MSLHRPLRASARASSLSLCALCTLPIVASAAPGGEDELPQGPPLLPRAERAEVEASQIEAKLRFLASDELEGRDTGSRGSLAAALWMRDSLSEMGFQGGGDELEGRDVRGFLQDIQRPEVSLPVGPDCQLVSAGEARQLLQGRDYDLLDAVGRSARLRPHLVQSADDLPAEVDAEVALVLDGRSSERRAWLTALGTPDGEGWGAVLRRGKRKEGEPRSSTRLPSTALGTRLDVRLHGASWAALVEGEVEALVFDVPAPTRRAAYNVIGVLPGVGTPARPELAQEVVVLTAHYDHLGTRAARDGDEPDTDRIYNGADDDASGTVALLEIAEALSAQPAPARTVVVMAVTGEEKGLLGTRYYIDQPLFPLERTVVNLNFEMLGRPDALAGGAGKLWLTGYERSNLGEALAERGISVVQDPRPEQQFFRRSDNYAFARLGIVAQTLSSYDLHDDYHTPADEADTLDYEHMQTALRACLSATLLLTSGELAPSWNPGGDPSDG